MRSLSALAARLQDGARGLAHRLGAGPPEAHVLVVEALHPVAPGAILDRPQAHDHGPRAGHLEGAPQAEDALSGLEAAGAGVAARQHRPFDARQIEGGDLLGREYAVLLLGPGGAALVGAG